MSKTILVTGSNGQLGNELKALSDAYDEYKIIFTDIGELDITNIDAINNFFKENQPDYCINCAAYTAVDMAEEEVDKAFLINEKAVENLAICCADYKTSLIHVSTDFVFDGKNHLPYVEEEDTNPLSIYGKSKLAGELKATSINSKTTIIRTSWLYGRFGNNFVKTMLNLGQVRDSLGVIFDQVGTPTNAKDLAEVMLTMIKEDFEIKNENKAVHFSNEGVASWYDFAHEIFNLKKINIQLNPIHSYEFTSKATRPHYSVLDKKRIKDNLNIKISHWKDSLSTCLKDL